MLNNFKYFTYERNGSWGFLKIKKKNRRELFDFPRKYCPMNWQKKLVYKL